MAELLARGTIVGETWEVEELLGRGGMGEVWLAHHRRVEGKRAAIKVLHAAGGEEGAFVARFKREAEIAARLEHPNIVQVFDYATLPGGEPYIVMELLRGESLKQRLARGPMPLAELEPLVAQLCSALHVAHARGVVHRDLKPDNLFLVPTPTGPQLKVLDFGISKLLDSHTVQTKEDVLIGTPLYMSPEQALGDNATLTAQSDLFTVAAICHEALTGAAPFRADGVAKIIYRILHVEPPAPEGLDEGRAAALRRALAKEPAQRTADVATFAAEFCGVSLGAAEKPEARGRANAEAGPPTRESARAAVPLANSQAPTKELGRPAAPPGTPAPEAPPTSESPRAPPAPGTPPDPRGPAGDATGVLVQRPGASAAGDSTGVPAERAGAGSARAAGSAAPSSPAPGAPAAGGPVVGLLITAAVIGAVVYVGASFATRSAPVGAAPAVAPRPHAEAPVDAGAPAAVSPVFGGVLDAGDPAVAGALLGDGAPDAAVAGEAPRHAARPPPPTEVPLDAVQQGLLADTETAFAAERYVDVLALTQKPALAASGRAMALRVMTACAVGNRGLANATSPRVPRAQLREVRKFCKARGVELL